jgi:hypothetical protein
MLEPVERPCEDRSAFIPDDLLVVKEADAQQAVQDFTGELTGVPDISGLEAGNQSEGVAPIRARVTGDRSFCVSGRAFFHVARLGRSTAVQTRAIAPFGIQLNPIRRICDHQPWFAFTK